MTPYMEMKLLAESSERGRLDAQSKLTTAQSELAAVRRRESLLKEKLADCEKSEAALREDLAVYKQANANLIESCAEKFDLLTAAEQRNAELMKAVEQSIEWFESISSGDGSGHADLARAIRRIAKLKPTESVSDACTSCDGSGEYIDAVGDWRGYCSCPAGVALKNKPTESGASE